MLFPVDFCDQVNVDPVQLPVTHSTHGISDEHRLVERFLGRNVTHERSSHPSTVARSGLLRRAKNLRRPHRRTEATASSSPKAVHGYISAPDSRLGISDNITHLYWRQKGDVQAHRPDLHGVDSPGGCELKTGDIRCG